VDRAEGRAGAFSAIRPQADDIRQVSRLAPENPFYSSGYIAARRALGGEVWLLGIRENGGQWTAGCPAFRMSGRVSRWLEIPSWPRLQDVEPFWKSLLSFCREHRVSRLELNSFASEAGPFPETNPGGESDPLRDGGVRGVMVSRRRCEYVLELHGSESGGYSLGRCSSNHARNIKRARKAGLTLQRGTDLEACRWHVRLMSASLMRRQERGEMISTGPVAKGISEQASEPAGEHESDEQVRLTEALVSHGAGELFQAVEGQRVRSSILVLRGERGGYYHSAGTSPEGMNCGASHFLVHQIAEQLRAEGLDRFNLGGADANSGGLERFKSGFGAVPIELEAAEVVLAGAVRRTLGRLGRLLDAVHSRARDRVASFRRSEAMP
jgi:hypothetical protein